MKISQPGSKFAGPRDDHAKRTGLEALEPRVLLAFTPVTLDGNGAAEVSSTLDFGEVEFFRLTTPTFANGENRDFVRILADGDDGENVDTLLGIFTSDSLQSARATDAFGVEIADSDGNGVLEGGTTVDAWIGAVLDGNTEYYIAVRSGSLMANTGQGDYTLRIETTSQDVTLSSARTIVSDTGSDETDILVRGTDRVFRITTGSASAFDSLITANAVADPSALDTRLDIYDEQGRLVVADSVGGRVSNAFVGWRGGQSETFYIRVRSDQFLVTPTALGEFTLVIEAQATDLGVDPITRLGFQDDQLAASISIAGNGAAGDPSNRARSDSRMFSFMAQSTGTALLSARPTTALVSGELVSITDRDDGSNGFYQTSYDRGFFNDLDIKFRIYDPDGNLLFVVDDNPATGSDSPSAEFSVVGGQTYFVVVDNFEFNAPATTIDFRIAVDASHNFLRDPATGERLSDDHPDFPSDLTGLSLEERQRLADLATPIPWYDPEQLFADRGFVQRGYGDGVIHGFGDGDSDLFQFTPPVDMLTDFAPDTSGTTALIAGGQFNNVNGIDGSRVASAIASFDYGQWLPLNGSSPDRYDLLFPDGSFIDGTVYAMHPWTRTSAQGATETVLVIGGDFVVRDRTDTDPTLDPTTDSLVSGIRNIVVWDGISFSPLISPAAYEGSFITTLPAADGTFSGTPNLTDNNGNELNNFDSRLAWSLNAPVRALDSYDTDGNGTLELIIGGEFTGIEGTAAVGAAPSQRLTAFQIDVVGSNVFTGWVPLGAGLNSTVWDLQNFTPTAPEGTDPDAVVPPSIYAAQDDGRIAQITYNPVGGDLTVVPGAVTTQLVSGDPSAVYALTVHDPAPVAVADGMGGTEELDLPPYLAFGGIFDRVSNANNSNSVALWDGYSDFIGLNGANPIANGSSAATVRALTSWLPPQVGSNQAISSLGTNHDAGQRFLVVGGEFTGSNSGSNVAVWVRSTVPPPTPEDTSPDPEDENDWYGLGGLFGPALGVDGVVYALASYADSEQDGGQDYVDDDNLAGDGEVLVIGGAFTGVEDYDITGNGTVDDADTDVLTLQGLKSTNVVEYGFDSTLQFRAAGQGADDTVFALQSWTPTQGTLPFGRAGSTLQIRVSGSIETLIGDLDVNVNLYDSQLQVVASGQIVDALVDRGEGRPDDPAGSNDASLYVDFGDTAGAQLWGGEVYYLEVVTADADADTGRNFPSGRYTIEIMVDGFVDDNAVSFDNNVSDLFDAADNSNFDGAPAEDDVTDNPNVVDLRIDPVFGTSLISRIFPDSYRTRPDGSEPETGSALGRIDAYDDTDIYTFTAVRDGFAEIIVTTQDLRDSFTSNVGAGFSKIYDSPLDSVVRVFNANLTQIAYNDNVNGLSTTTGLLNFGFDVDGDGEVQDTERQTFGASDSRVVIPVVAGQQYFVQVESAQLRNYLDYVALGTDNVDWRHALGSYDIALNVSPSPSQTAVPNGDDYIDITDSIVNGGAPLGFDANGDVTVSGTIEDRTATPSRPVDTDVFYFRPEATGTYTITAARDGGTLTPEFDLFDDTAGTFLSTIGGAQADPGNGIATASLEVVGGQLYFIIVSGVNGSVGDYQLSIDGVTVTDAEANFGQWDDATAITVSTSTNTGSGTGRIDFGADVDVFSFTAPQFADYRITVTNSAGLSLDVDVYEQQIAPLAVSANPSERIVTQLLRSGNGEVTVPATPSRISAGTLPDRSGNGALDLSAYFIVIRQNQLIDASGDYTVTIDLLAADDHPNGGQDIFATPIVVNSTTGAGTSSGTFEVEGDTDQFTFTVPATGEASVTASVTDGSDLQLRIQVLDPTDNTTVLATGDSASAGDDATATFEGVRGTSYLVVVSVISTDPLTGDYGLTIAATGLDDHANTGEFGFATPIALDTFTGDGQFPGIGGTRPTINPASDTDLFSFTTLAVGSVTVTVTPFITDASDQFTPLVSVFDSSFQAVVSNIALTPQGTVSVTVPSSSNPVETYYILVGDARSTADAIDVSPYEITLDGPDIRTNPSDVDFGTPTAAPTATPAGETTVNGGINQSGERDLVTFTVPERSRDLQVFIQLVAVDSAGNASPLNGQINIFVDSDPNTPITGESDPELVSVSGGNVNVGGPGTAARFEFVATAPGPNTPETTYYVIVSGVDADDVGDYRLDVVVEPENFTYYMPEGWAGEGIREFVSLANPSSTTNVTYSVIAYYENTSLAPTTIASNLVIPAGSRGGLTLSDALRYNASGGLQADGGFSVAGLNINEGYSLVITADGALAASSSRYDANITTGSTTGETFTDQTSSLWSFARVERTPGEVNDFVLVYNPNSFSVDITLSTVLSSGATVTLTQTVEANRRAGWNIDAESSLPSGIFGAIVSATPTPTGNSTTDAANAAAFIGVVASQTHFESTVTGGRGFAAIGDPNGGSRALAIPTITDSASIESEIVIFNPGTTDVTVTINGSYLADGLPAIFNSQTIAAGQVLRLADASLGLIANQPAGLEFVASAPITVLGVENRFGESNSVAGESLAAEAWYFGDAFINAALAGDFYLENISIYNPNPDLAASPLDVTATLLFFNSDTGAIGDSADITVSVDSRGFASLNLHEADEILSRTDPLSFFSLVVTADDPFIVNFYHYDLFLNGGWGVVGTPFGLVNPLSEIIPLT